MIPGSAEICDMRAFELVEAFKLSEISALEVVTSHFQKIESYNASINAFTEITYDRAIKQAKRLDNLRKTDQGTKQLSCVTMAVKNLFDLENVTTLAGSLVLKKEAPAKRDAVVASRLIKADALILGALNMGEFAYDFTGENAHYGASRNPHDLSLMSGGSSGGSAAAVAAGLVSVALGSDTNGSIRVPAAFCGIFGLKPTYGRLPRTGTFPFVDSLDHVGPMARCVNDLALVFDQMQGEDPGDPTTNKDMLNLSCLGILKNKPELRVARLAGWFCGQGEQNTDLATDNVAKALGASDFIEIEMAEAARAAAYVITNVESSALHLNKLKTDREKYDPFVYNRLCAGSLVPGIHYVKAQRLRYEFQESLKGVFRDYDILVAPTTPMAAPKIGTQTCKINGETVALRPNIGVYTQPLSFVGLPVVSCPYWIDGICYGVQIIAAPWREDLALLASYFLEMSETCAAVTPSKIKKWN